MKLRLAYLLPFLFLFGQFVYASKKEERTIIEKTNEWNIANKSLK